MKSRIFSVFCAVLVIGLVSGVSSAGTRVSVTGDRVNVRARSDLRGEVVCTVLEGDILEAVEGMDADWVKIVPPEKTDLWVYSDLVKDGIVSVSSLRVRSGPGIAYPIVGTLGRGDKLTVRGRNADWLRIEPPAGTYLWISREYVEPVRKPEKPVKKPVDNKTDDKKNPKLKPQVKKKVPRKPPMPVRGGALPSSENDGASASKPPRAVDDSARSNTGTEPENTEIRPVPDVSSALKGAPLDESLEQGAEVTAVGELRKAGYVFRRPSPYRIVGEDSRGRSVTSFYILGKEETLQALLGKKLRISGKKYWVTGVRYPLIDPSRIEQDTD